MKKQGDGIREGSGESVSGIGNVLDVKLSDKLTTCIIMIYNFCINYIILHVSASHN